MCSCPQTNYQLDRFNLKETPCCGHTAAELYKNLLLIMGHCSRRKGLKLEFVHFITTLDNVVLFYESIIS